MTTKIDVPMWQQRVSRALDLSSQKDSERNNILDLYQGRFFGDTFAKTDNKSEVNFTYRYTKVKVGGAYAKDPHIFARARSTKWVRFAETMEIVLNYYWRELKLKRKIKNSIIDGVLIPPGWIGIGYTGQLVKSRRRQQEDIFSELKSIKTKTEGQFGILDETIKNDDVFAKYIPSWNIVWPDGYHNIRETPYLVEIQQIALVDLFRNTLFKDSRLRIPQMQSFGRIERPTQFKMKANPPLFRNKVSDDEIRTIRLFHVWDKRDNMRFTLAENLFDDTLFEQEWNYLIEGFPYYDLIFNRIPPSDSEANSYPLSDIVPMIPQLRDLSIINSAMLRHGKRQGSVILVKKGTYTTEEIHNMQNASDIEVIQLESLSAETLTHFNTPALPKDWYNLRELIIEDLMRTSGFQQLLSQQKGIETATESENLRQGEVIIRSEDIDTVEDFTVDIARGLSGLLWQFKNRDQIAEIIGEPVSEEMWPTLPDDMDEARKIIQSEIQLRIDAGSTRPPKDEAVERKQWSDLVFGLKAAFPNRLKDDVVLRQLLKKFDFKDIDEAVVKFDEQEIQVAQQENQLLLQGIVQLVSPNENHQLHLQVHGQVSQSPGLQLTPEYDKHVLDHAKFLELQMPKVNPQRGDTKVSPLTTQPELRRRGTPENVDLQGGATNILKGVGANVGGGI